MKVHPYLRRTPTSPEAGYFLIVIMLFLTLLAISLTVAVSPIAQQIRREREIELIHRGRQYARAIRLFYRKFGRYPGRIEELENTNNLRFLRKRYKDPVTGNAFRLIHYGEAQSLMARSGPVMPGATTPGGTSGNPSATNPFASTFSSVMSGSSPGGSNPSGAAAGTTSSPTAGQSTTTTTDSSQSGSTSGSSTFFSSGSSSGSSSTSSQPGTPAGQMGILPGGAGFGGGAIVGVASTSPKQSIKELNQKNHYKDWEFVYDPTLDLSMAQQVIGAPGQNPLAPGMQPQTGFGQPGGNPGMTPTPQPAPTPPR